MMETNVLSFIRAGDGKCIHHVYTVYSEREEAQPSAIPSGASPRASSRSWYYTK